MSALIDTVGAVIELALYAGGWFLDLVGVKHGPPRTRPGRHQAPHAVRKRKQASPRALFSRRPTA